MKYTAVLMLFLGAISFSEAKRSTDLVQVIEANGMTAVVESESESESDDELVDVSIKKGDTGIIDATTPPNDLASPTKKGPSIYADPLMTILPNPRVS